MKILETIFFYLTIILPSFILLIMILKAKKMAKPKYRQKLFKIFLMLLIINGAILTVLKIINSKADFNIIDDKNTSSKINESNNPKESIDNKEPKQSNTNTVDPDLPTNNDKPTKPTTNTQTGTTSKGFTIETREGVTYIDGYMVANKTYPLPENYVPENTYKKITNPNGACAECLINDAYQAYTSLKKEATSNGLNLWIASGFRSYNYQAGLYNSYVKNRGGKEKADTFSARPGHSEHQTGYAFDLNSVDSSFADTKEGKWIDKNCYKYGFIIRYPKDKDNETGYKYEPWHLRYVGIDLATKLYNAGDWITMEDYFGITSEYAD